MDLEKEWYNIAETSNIVGLSKQSIRRDIKAGRIENIKRQGKLFFINNLTVIFVSEYVVASITNPC